MPAAKKVLVIDDEPAMGEVIQDFLDQNGFKTFTATHANQGLEIVEKENPDVILLDIIMPEVSGLDCLKKIKASHPNTIVIIISGLQDQEIAKQALKEGAYDYLTKPFELSYLLDHFLARLFPS